GDLLVDIDDDVAFVVLDLLERYAANDTVAERLDDVAGLDDGTDVDAVNGSAIVLGDDDVLSYVDQATGEVAGVGRLESRIRQSLTSAVRRDEVLQHRETFTEVRRDGRFDDFAGRLSHQSAHTGELTNLLLGSSSAGVGHDVDGVDVTLFVMTLHGAEHLVGHLFSNGRPDFDDLVVALAIGDGTVQVLLLNADHRLLGVLHDLGLARRDDHVVDTDRQAGARCVLEAQHLDFVQHLDRSLEAELEVAEVHQLTDALLLEQAVDVRHAGRSGAHTIVQDGASDRGVDELTVHRDRIGVHYVLIVIRGGEVHNFTGVAQADGSQGFDFATFLREDHFFDVGECAAFTLGALTFLGQVIHSEHHVLGRNGDRLTGGWRQDVVRGEHQHAGFDLGFRRQRDVYRHLVAVEVGVERRADERVNLDGLAFHQHRLKSLDAEAVKGWGAVQEHWVVFNHLFEDVPNDGFLLLHHFFCLLDGGAVAGLFEPVIDKRLEQFESHLLRQTALVQLELRTDDDYRTARVVHTLAQQVLTEATLLALEGIAEGLERAIVGATQHATTTTVIEQGVDGFLQHALFIAHDDFRSVQVHQLLQTVVTVDDATIEIVEIGRRETATVEWNEGTQLRRNDRNHVENHPLRLVTGLAERFDHLETLGVLESLLQGGLVAHLLAQFNRLGVDVNTLEQFLDGFRAHHGFEARSTVCLVEFA